VIYQIKVWAVGASEPILTIRVIRGPKNFRASELLRATLRSSVVNPGERKRTLGVLALLRDIQ